MDDARLGTTTSKGRPNARLPVVFAVLITIATSCGSDPVTPSGEGSRPPSASASQTAPSTSASDAVASPGASPSESPGAAASTAPPGPPSVQPYTPPPDMEPLEDEVCLSLASRADVEAALGISIGDITAQGTDPNIALTCRYTAASGGGQLLVTTATGEPDAYDDELAIATTYGQDPQDLEGIGDRAFYGAATSAAPEQVVFVKGPVLVRVWNQTAATIGEADFAALATGIASAIHGETPPDP